STLPFNSGSGYFYYRFPNRVGPMSSMGGLYGASPEQFTRVPVRIYIPQLCTIHTEQGSSDAHELTDHRVLQRHRTKPSGSLPARDSTVDRRAIGSDSRLHTVALPVARAQRIQRRCPGSDPRGDSGVSGES